MEYLSKQISYFVQGYLILEQFIWNLPTFVLFAFGIINELQNIAYIHIPFLEKSLKLSKEIQIFRIISRPNLWFNNDAIMSYVFFVYVNTFYFSCFLFTYLIINRRNNMLNQITKLFHDSQSMKFLMIFLNISMHLIKLGLGYVIIEVSLLQIKQAEPFQIILNSYNIALIAILIPASTGLFSYNWALDFYREYMVINESYLTNLRIAIRYVQILILTLNYNNLILEYISIFLPILSSIVHIYTMQKKKQYIYGIYYKFILFINSMEIVLASQYLLKLLFQDFDFEYLWIILTLVPFQYFKNSAQNSFWFIFLNFQKVEIECNNFVLFLIIYNMLRNKISFSNIVLSMYLSQHQKLCNKLACNCHSYQSLNVEQITIEIFISDLQKFYETQLNDMSFTCTQEQIVFSYLQLLFFRKQYLKVYKYFHIIFPDAKEKHQNKLSSIAWTQSQEIHQAAFKFDNFHKLSVLQVAKSLMRMDIEKQFSIQQTFQTSNSQKLHVRIAEFLEYENHKNIIKHVIEKTIKHKLKYFDKLNKMDSSEKQLQLAYDLIHNLISGREQIKKSFECFANQARQSILMFYNLELLNDLISSYIQSLESEKGDEISSKSNTKSFLEELSYLIVQINELDRIVILKKHFNDRGLQHFENTSTFEKMIPSFIVHFHSMLIDGFISGLPNKFYQQFNETYLQISTGLIRRVDLAMDVVQINLMSIEMVVFFKKKNDQTFVIILDDYNNILSFDESLFCEYFGFDKQYAQMFIGINIQFIIPTFNMLHQNMLNDYCQLEAFFLDSEKISYDQLVKVAHTNQWIQIWNEQYLKAYWAEIELTKKNILGVYNYQVVSLKSFKKNLSQQEINFTQFQNLQSNIQNETPINESIIVDKPYYLDEMVEDHLNSQRTLQRQFSDYKEYLLFQEQKKRFLFQTQIKIFDEEIFQESCASFSNNVEKNNNGIEKIRQEVASSQQSIFSTLQKLDCYAQFNIVNEFTNSKKKPITLVFIIILIFFMKIISLIGFSLYLYEIDRFHEYRIDFELLKIKNDVFYPILSFQIIRFAILNYNQELQSNYITQQECKDLLEFPMSKIVGSYEFLKNGIDNLFSQQSNQELFEDESLALYYLDHNELGETKTMNLRSTLNVILNYQFDIQNSYLTTGSANFGSPYLYFQYKNFPVLYQEFQKINQILLEEFILKAENNYSKNNLVFSIVIVFAFLIEAAIIYQNVQFQLQNGKLKQFLFHFQNEYYIQQDQLRLEKHLENIQKNFNFLTYYQLKIHDMNKYQQQLKQTYLKSPNKKKQTFTVKKIQPFHALVKFIHFIFCFIILFVYSLKIQNFHSIIQNTAKFYQQYINLNIDLLVIYSSREVLYHKQMFSFLLQEDFDNYFNILQESLERIDTFINGSDIVDSKHVFVSQSFFDLLQKFSESNLCDQLNYINNTNITICPQTLQGLLLKGFSPTIVNIKNSISTELIQTNFTTRTQFPILELEGIYLLCYSLQYLLDDFSHYFHKENQEIELQYNIIIVICIIISLLYGVFLLKYLEIVEWKNFQLLMQFFYVVPQSAIILDDQFIRNARFFIKNDTLI